MKLTLTPSVSSRAGAPEPAAIEPEPAPAAQPVAPSRPAAVLEMQAMDAAEHDASLIEEKGVVTEASAASLNRPGYPRISRLRGEEGLVTLSIEVLASGRAGKVDVVQSSGHRRLDEAARKAALGSTYTPAQQLGHTVDSVIELSFTFRLTDD
jgi:protein TonB